MKKDDDLKEIVGRPSLHPLVVLIPFPGWFFLRVVTSLWGVGVGVPRVRARRMEPRSFVGR